MDATLEQLYPTQIEKAKLLLVQRRGFDEIAEMLTNEGLSSHQVKEIVSKLKADYYGEKRKVGTKTILLGSVFLFIGFVATCACFHSDLPINWVMYGFTSLGLLIMFKGLYDIFG